MIRAPRSGIQAVVPVKRIDRAKLRLRPVLSDAERERLARAMLDDVLVLLADLDVLSAILVVTSDPWASRFGRGFGADVLHDEAEAGTNAAVRLAFGELPQDGTVLVVPADIPFATGAEIREAVAALGTAQVVLAPAQKDGGTNLLALASQVLVPAFGPESFARHREAARSVGIEPGVLHLSGVGHDIDRPDDLVGLPAAGGRRTRTLLGEMEIAERLDRTALMGSGM